VLTIHGVPDSAHPWVTTPPALFEEYLHWLHDHRYTVIGLRDLAPYVAPRRTAAPAREPGQALQEQSNSLNPTTPSKAVKGSAALLRLCQQAACRHRSGRENRVRSRPDPERS
jgi:hypothetical protein